MNVYTPILILGILAFGFAAFSVLTASLTGPKRYRPGNSDFQKIVSKYCFPLFLSWCMPV